jgi:hypothetical protein
MTSHTKKFAVAEISDLIWPPALKVPSKRFRLLVAADTSKLSTDLISEFALAALEHGMVYFCSWGPGCERFHDIVDEVVVADDLTQQKFSGSKPGDVIMTTSHDDESLEEALEFLPFAIPTEGFLPDSDFRLVICLNNPAWAYKQTSSCNQRNSSLSFNEPDLASAAPKVRLAQTRCRTVLPLDSRLGNVDPRTPAADTATVQSPIERHS